MDSNSNSKRKIELITLSSSSSDSSTESKEKRIKNDIKERFENYKLLSEDDDEKLILSQNSIRQYIKIFGEIVDDMEIYEKNMEKLINIIDNFKNNDSNILKQKSFSNLFELFYLNLSTKTNNSRSIKIALLLNNDLLKELKRLSLSSSSSSLKDNFVNKKTAKKISKLTIYLEKLKKSVNKYQSKEITLDEMDDHTEFTQLPRFQKRIIQKWQEREKLLNRSINTGSLLYQKFTYNQLENNYLNHLIEQYVNNYLQQLYNNEQKLLNLNQNNEKYKLKWFNIIEMKEYLLNEMEKRKINYQLDDNLLKKIYEYILNDLNNRRNAIHKEFLDNYLLLDDNIDNNENNNDNDKNLLEKLNENSVKSKKDMETIINEFRKKDLDTNNNNDNDNDVKTLGWDDQKQDTDDEDDDDGSKEGGDEDGENDNNDDDDSEIDNDDDDDKVIELEDEEK